MAQLRLLAQLVDGQVRGNPDVEIARVVPIQQAGEGDLTFVANPKYLSFLHECRASAVIVAPDVEVPPQVPNVLVTPNPYLAFAKILGYLHQGPAVVPGIQAGSQIAASARIDPQATVFPGCYVGERVQVGAGTVLYPGVCLYDDVVVGRQCRLHAHAVVREGCRLGDRVILQPSAVIGSDGFGFAPDGSRYVKIPQVGIVVLEEDVEVGSCTCIDRATLGETRIKRGTKIDNLVQIAHNVEIGEDCILVAQGGYAGSSKIGNHCTFGGQSAVAGHLRVGDHVTIGARGGISGDLDAPHQVLSGAPVMPHKVWARSVMTLPKLPEMRKEMQQLKKRLDELEALMKENNRA